tara:strand:- start:25992 stop:26219 length:228 start_codon:yes stop_codon:yes gene_type:complete
MNIIRQVKPKGAPIIVDALLDDDGNIIKETLKIYPILPTDPPLIGEGLPYEQTKDLLFENSITFSQNTPNQNEID